MTIAELKKLLEKSGLPVAYRQFEKEDNVSLPFITFFRETDDNIPADDKVYKKIHNCRVELCTALKNLALENTVEKLFDENEIFYEADEVYIEDEKMYMVVYDIQILE